MAFESSYRDEKDLYDSVLEEHHEDVLEEYREREVISCDYEDPLDYLEERRDSEAVDQVLEVAEFKKIIDGDAVGKTGGVAGITSIASNPASD